jgi:hypothetical protein
MMMLGKLTKRRRSNCALSAVLLFVSLSAQATSIDIYEFSVFMNAAELGASSVGETQLAFGAAGLNEFSATGLSFSAQNNLGTDNTGTLSWDITNNTGMDLSSTWLFGFLDAEIDTPVNTFFNESGGIANFIPGSGSGDTQADSWEIDEPGYAFGDIYNNILVGSLDNSNGIAGTDDVSLALGFNIGELLIGEKLTVIFDLGLADNGGLLHSDSDSGMGFYFNGSVSKVDVPEPPILTLFLFGLLYLFVQAFMSRRSES